MYLTPYLKKTVEALCARDNFLWSPRKWDTECYPGFERSRRAIEILAEKGLVKLIEFGNDLLGTPRYLVKIIASEVAKYDKVVNTNARDTPE